MNTHLFFDTETASFKGPILQLAFEVYDGAGTFLYGVNTYFNHEFDYEIDPKAYEIHGIDKEFLALHGESGIGIGIALAGFADVCEAADVVVAHGIAFDHRMIHLDMQRGGLSGWPEYLSQLKGRFCTMTHPAINHLCSLKDVRGKPKNPSLSELHYRLFGEPISRAHRADVDAKATAKCYFELKRRGII